MNFLAAFVLYLLASSNVRGFAFTLGLTTLIDLFVVVLFTHPLVAMLSGTTFFGGGHKWSGLDPERLGADPGEVEQAVAASGQELRDGDILLFCSDHYNRTAGTPAFLNGFNGIHADVVHWMATSPADRVGLSR